MQAIHDEDTWQMFLTERSFLRAIGGGCNEAAAVDVRMDGQKVSVRARYAGDGLHMKEKTVTGTRCGNIEEDRKLGSFTGRTDSGKASERQSLSDRCRTGRYRPDNNERHGSPERSRCDCL